ncbi:MAG: carboxynorspermidine decarboxylase [Deltaproteobacteria bacterium]|nr:carboxynorspermidine decarboxylase [Deltaproteobacteria bacterium]
MNKINTPCIVFDEDRVKSNLSVIENLTIRTGVKFLLALKAFALFPTFVLIRPYVVGATSGSLCETRLGKEELGGEVHSYAPAFLASEFDDIALNSTHLIFNSLSQYAAYAKRALDLKPDLSLGLRINPLVSVSTRKEYDPCESGSRFGIRFSELREILENIEGLHFHIHCENTSCAGLELLFATIEDQIGNRLNKLKWLNLGGGLVVTDKDFDFENFVALIKAFKSKYPHLVLYMEPGAAYVWQAGYLLTSVVDIIEAEGTKTAILDVSFEAHLNDTLLGWRPSIVGASEVDADIDNHNLYKLGGISCAACDVLAEYAFKKPLNIGDQIIIEDALHYTLVKMTCFCGTLPPSIAIKKSNGEIQYLKAFSYSDYKNRLG